MQILCTIIPSCHVELLRCPQVECTRLNQESRTVSHHRLQLSLARQTTCTSATHLTHFGVHLPPQESQQSSFNTSVKNTTIQPGILLQVLHPLTLWARIVVPKALLGMIPSPTKLVRTHRCNAVMPLPSRHGCILHKTPKDPSDQKCGQGQRDQSKKSKQNTDLRPFPNAMP